MIPLPYRSLRPESADEAARRYADEWITSVTPPVREIHGLLRRGAPDAAVRPLPAERPGPAGDGPLARVR